MDALSSQLVMTKSGIDMAISCDRVAELFVHHKTQSPIGSKGEQSVGIKASGKLIEQLLNKFELYHECVAEANVQLRRKMKASMRANGLLILNERQKDVEICTTMTVLAYNNMVYAIISRAHKLRTKPTDDLSFSMRYSRIIENAVQISIAVTNQLLDFSLLFHR